MLTFLSTALSFTGTDKLVPLGSLYVEPHPTYGARIWRYILMRGGAIAAGEGVMQETGTDANEVIISGASAPNARMKGVAQHAIAQDSYGWVLCDGVGYCDSDGTTDADTIQLTAANGRFTNGTAITSENCVWAMETENPAGAGGTFLAVIRML